MKCSKCKLGEIFSDIYLGILVTFIVFVLFMNKLYDKDLIIMVSAYIVIFPFLLFCFAVIGYFVRSFIAEINKLFYY
jgi:hypothetical protein